MARGDVKQALAAMERCSAIWAREHKPDEAVHKLINGIEVYLAAGRETTVQELIAAADRRAARMVSSVRLASLEYAK